MSMYNKERYSQRRENKLFHTKERKRKTLHKMYNDEDYLHYYSDTSNKYIDIIPIRDYPIYPYINHGFRQWVWIMKPNTKYYTKHRKEMRKKGKEKDENYINPNIKLTKKDIRDIINER